MRLTLGMMAGAVIASMTLAPDPALAQGGRPLRVDGTQALSFGSVIPGIPVHVLKTDALRSGQIQIRGEKFSVLQLEFVLPSSMAGPGTASMPLTFDAADAGFSADESITAQTTFDPRAPAFGQLSKNGRGMVFLGGTVRPPSTQPAGSYSAGITLTVSYTGT